MATTKPPATRKWTLLAISVLVASLLFWAVRDYISLSYLADREEQLRSVQMQYPITSVLAAVLIYVSITGLSLPGAAVMSLSYAWYFGFWKGLVIVSFGSTGGATIAFLLSRYLFRDWVQHRMQERLGRINEAFEREGAFYLFSLRLIPAVPFFVINAVMGLTRIRAFTFWWVSQLGMLPGTIAYVYAGSTVPSLQTLAERGASGILNLQLVAAFALLGILPIAIKRTVAMVNHWNGRKR
ncbi:MAG: TVP38/TMEM64 family protein [Planctomycetales bacterium]|nr:TVP38/TMEM64 family protein [Planctomycetales bacterium]